MDSPLSKPARIYLDHAATGWPKPEAVYGAVEAQMRQSGAAAGRGAYGHALRSNAILSQCRQLASRLFSADAAGAIVLVHNGTAALNLAIHGVLAEGDHVVTTAAEHNSVLRPLEWLRKRRGIAVDTVRCDVEGRVRSDEVLRCVRPETRLVAMVHGSNVTGSVQPIAEVAAGLKAGPHAETLLLCDAAQTAGLLPINVDALGVDLLAMPGHKGLCGPLGTGLLYVGPRAAERIEPLVQGGTGSRSDSLAMPTELPDRLESGNANVPALAGLAEGLRGVLQMDLQGTAERQRERTRWLVDQLVAVPGVRVISGAELPIVSLVIDNLDCRQAVAILDAEFGIEVRAGLHCAPLIHRYLGTEPSGTLRISFAPLTGDDELEAVIAAIRELASAT